LKLTVGLLIETQCKGEQPMIRSLADDDVGNPEFSFHCS